MNSLFNLFIHQAQAQREVASSEAQTQSSDALYKLTDCLEKLQTNEKQGSEKELDSRVVSQASGIFSSDNKERKREVGGDIIHSSHGASYGKLESSHLQSSSPLGRLFSVSDSTAAVYDDESSRSLGDLGLQEGWAVDSDEEPPLESSSDHEEDNPEMRHHAEDEDDYLRSCSSENLCLLSAVSQSDDSPRPEDPDNQAKEGTSSTEGPLRPQSHCSNLLSPQSLPSPLASDWQALEHIKHGGETFDVPDGSLCELDVDLSYQILCLPFDKVTFYFTFYGIGFNSCIVREENL